MGKKKKKLNAELSHLSGFSSIPFLNEIIFNGENQQQKQFKQEDDVKEENQEDVEVSMPNNCCFYNHLIFFFIEKT